MKRLALAILLLFLLVLSVPALRARAAPRFAALGSAIWDRIEGPLTPVLTPWRTVNTKSEISRVTNSLIGRRNQGFPPPDQDEFQAYIAARDIDPAGVDAWGQPYLLEIEPDSVRVRSAGPDRLPQTEDDIVTAIRYPTSARSVRGRR